MTTDYTTSDAEAVYDACASIPEGKVISYGDLAQLVGRPRSHSRSVSSILGHRPSVDTDLDPLPWWRVVKENGTLLDAHLITGPRAQWVNWALDRLAAEGVPLTGEGVRRRVDMRHATRMPIPEGIAPWQPTPKVKQVREAVPCERHEKVQAVCRDCSPAR
jgi:alkylated DNA nucleotide flippase Atl1